MVVECSSFSEIEANANLMVQLETLPSTTFSNSEENSFLVEL